ncbi:hypothetical protein N7513_007816 [Penicillium frequentans]|nr:hypothetical protein N7513_007816 [Penicillium glabrum]
MHFLTGLNVLLALATASNGSPVKRTNDVEITFIGAANAQFTQNFPADGSTVSICPFTLLPDVLSISHISSADASVQCTFHGIDNSVTTVSGAELVDVGPPQTQISGSCSATGSSGSTTPPSNPPSGNNGGQGVSSGNVEVVFIGAANAEFTQSFPVNGQATQISNVLSISHIELTTGGVMCTFHGIDNSVTTVSGAELVDVGPPQTQLSGSCQSL